MFKRPHYIALTLIVVLTLIFLNLPSQTAARLKLAIGSLFLPLFGLASSSHQLADKAGNAVVSRSDLLKENEALRRQNQQLQIGAMQAKEIAAENARLRKYFGWHEAGHWKGRLARVVLQDPANWWRTVQIDIGSREGVRAGMAVLTVDGLVGRVASVSLTHSQVVLLGDPACKVSAYAGNTARYLGTVVPNGALYNSEVVLTYLPQDAKLAPGQEVVTSGEGGVFPKGIRIGKIVGWHAAEYGLYTEATVKLDANPSGLEEVWVLMP